MKNRAKEDIEKFNRCLISHIWKNMGTFFNKHRGYMLFLCRKKWLIHSYVLIICLIDASHCTTPLIVLDFLGSCSPNKRSDWNCFICICWFNLLIHLGILIIRPNRLIKLNSALISCFKNISTFFIRGIDVKMRNEISLSGRVIVGLRTWTMGQGGLNLYSCCTIRFLGDLGPMI